MSFVNKVIGRRHLLKGFLIAGPTLVVAARLDLRPAGAAIPGSPELQEHQDFTEHLHPGRRPFFYDLLVEIKPDNLVTSRSPGWMSAKGS